MKKIRELLQKRSRLLLPVIAAACLLAALAVWHWGDIQSYLGTFLGQVDLATVREGDASGLQKDDARRRTLNIYAEDLTGAFNPAFAASAGDRAVSSAVFEPVMRRTGKGALFPELASRVDVSDDGLAYTVRLRHGVRFSDGDELTSRDVCASIAAMALASGGGRGYAGIRGMEGFLARPVDWPEGLSMPDEDTAVITFDSASPDNLAVLETRVQKGDFMDGLADGQAFTRLQMRAQGGVGTGAYVFGAESMGGQAVLTRSDTYRRGIQDIGTVRFTSVSFYDVPEALEAGDIDLALVSGESPLFQSFYDAPQFTIYEKPLNQLYCLEMNRNHSALRHSDVRRAVSLAIDRDALLEGGLSRYMSPAAGLPLPHTAFCADNEPDYDGKAARALVDAYYQQAPGALTLRLPIVEGNELQRALADGVRRQVGKAGIDVEVVALAQQDYLSEVFLQNNFDLYLTALSLDGADASAYGQLAGDRDSLPVGIQDDALTQAVSEAMAAYTPDRAAYAVQAVNRAANETLPVVPLAHGKQFLMVSADLKGYSASPFTGLLDNLWNIRVR